MSEEKKVPDKKEFLKKKSPIKMPSNLEAVYDGNGNFIGRKPREALIPEIANTPADYINILSKSDYSIQTRFHVLTSFLTLHESELDTLFSVPDEKMQEIINNLPADDLNFLFGQLNEVKSEKIIPYLKLTATRILSLPNCKDWQKAEVTKVLEKRNVQLD